MWISVGCGYLYLNCLAVGTRQEICRKAHHRWKLKKMAVAHRIGSVDIGGASVIIAVSSAHRREALEVRDSVIVIQKPTIMSVKHRWHPVAVTTQQLSTVSCCVQACHWAIDELKATVPIWKKELYENGEVWKENLQSRNMGLQALA